MKSTYKKAMKRIEKSRRTIIGDTKEKQMTHLEKIQEIGRNYDKELKKVATRNSSSLANLEVSAQGNKAILNILLEIAKMLDAIHKYVKDVEEAQSIPDREPTLDIPA